MLGRMLVRFPARLPRSLLQPNHGLNNITPILLPIRTYATPGRPKSVVGEPSRPVKRSVKKAAAKPLDGTSSAEKKVAAKKKPATKRKSAKEQTPEQIALKAELQAAKKERLEKRKAARTVKKNAAAEKEKIKQLKTIALDPPGTKAYSNGYNAFLTEKFKNHTITKGEDTVAQITRRIAAEWHNISAAEKEHFNHIRITKNEEQYAVFKRWVESHTPEQIRLANEARYSLRRKLPKKKSTWGMIPDERAPKRPANAFVLFSANRQSSGDLDGITVPEASKLISQEWKALSSSERDKYYKLQEDDRNRFYSDYTTIFGHPPPYMKLTSAEETA